MGDLEQLRDKAKYYREQALSAATESERKVLLSIAAGADQITYLLETSRTRRMASAAQSQGQNLV